MMEDNQFSLPPISGEGEQVPLKEMMPEKPLVEEINPSEDLPKKPSKLIVWGLIVLVIILLGALVYLAMLAFSPKEEIKDEFIPSPSPEATPSAESTSSAQLIKQIKERTEKLEFQVKGLNLEEVDLTFPSFDFDIEFAQ